LKIRLLTLALDDLEAGHRFYYHTIFTTMSFSVLAHAAMRSTAWVRWR